MPDLQLHIPSPVQEIVFSDFVAANIKIFMKREDHIHPQISGNKWRKLKYHFAAAKAETKTGIITFGGAYSNHLAAAAFAAKNLSYKAIGFVRGEITDPENETLAFLRICGMQLFPLSREAYKHKNDPDFLADIAVLFPDYFIIPEGGASAHGVLGCAEILTETNQNFDFVACPVGTATTFSGLILSALKNTKLLGFCALKNGGYLAQVVEDNIREAQTKNPQIELNKLPEWSLQTEYHCGGFGKVTPELIRFMNLFYDETKIPLDPVYTGKMMLGLADLARSGKLKNCSILALHTGGLQGIKGMNQRLKNKNLHINYA